MKDIDFLTAAESYAEVVSAKERLAYIKGQVKLLAKGEDFPNSVLGAMTVGIIQFIINVIVNFVKYIALVITTLVSDSGIIPGIISALQGIFGESYIPQNETLKISDIKEIKSKIEYVKSIVSRRVNQVKENKKSWYSKETYLNKYKLIIDTKIVKERYFEDEFLKNITDLDQVIPIVNEMRNAYKQDTKNNNPNNWKVNNHIYVKDNADLKRYIISYRDILKETYNDIMLPFIDYNKEVEKKFNDIIKNLNKVKNKLTDDIELHVFTKYTENLFPYIVQNFKNLNNMISWLRVEIVSNLLVLTGSKM